MNYKLVMIIVACVAIIALAAYLLRGTQNAVQSATSTQSSANLQTTPASSQQSHAASSNAVLFNDTPYSQYSYLISSPSLSQQAQSALAGFKLVRTQLQNGSVEMNISLAASGQGNRVVLAPGYKMYIIEATFGDDGYGFDSSLGDDGFVVVNSTGYLA